jgi:hypothetical protein
MIICNVLTCENNSVNTGDFNPDDKYDTPQCMADIVEINKGVCVTNDR